MPCIWHRDNMTHNYYGIWLNDTWVLILRSVIISAHLLYQSHPPIFYTILAMLPCLTLKYTARFKQLKIHLFLMLITPKSKSADLNVSLAMKRGEKYLQDTAIILRSVSLQLKDLIAFAKNSFT